MENSKPIKVYEGQKRYVFISYAHANSDKVLPVLRVLDRDLYRFWYDTGIEVGSQWPEVVANQLLNCDTTVFFISQRFALSQNCDREVHYAVSERKKMICVKIEDVNLPSDMAMQLSVAEFIDAREMDAEQIASEIENRLGEELIGDGVEGYEKIIEKKKNTNIWRILTIILAALMLASTIAAVGYFMGWFSQTGASGEVIAGENGEEIEITRFNDELTRDILLGSYNSQALYLCGNVMVNNGDEIKYKNGTWFIGEESIEKGNMKDCDVIASKKEILYLTLANQSISDCSSLTKMTQLIYLDLSGNPISDLSFLSGMENIQKLKLVDVAVTDYSVLSSLEQLDELTISVDQLALVLTAVDLGEVDVIVK